METIGERILRLRTSKKMTQETLAKKIGISREAISKWEKGNTSNIKLDNLMILCKIFGLTAEELITGNYHSNKTNDNTSETIKPNSDIKKALMDLINVIDDSKLTIGVAHIIEDIINAPLPQLKTLQTVVHALCEPRNEYIVDTLKRNTK